MPTLLLSLITALQMLSSFTRYVTDDYQPIDSLYACFRGENTMGSDERGVRTNADLSMVAAFMVRYAQGEVALPVGVTYQQLDTMAQKTLRYAVATHKAVRKAKCRDGRYWGSVGRDDHQWESSLWAMSVAYSAFFQWDRLPEEVRADVYELLKAECAYELERDIPTGYKGDTKAEENGWEVDVLAATLGLFPDDPLAPRWFERMREFAINCYSHPSDANDRTVIDPWYDGKTVADLYKGANLYADWTLQNHDFFHTSYQNVVIQELGEAALALRLFQTARASHLPGSAQGASPSRPVRWRSAALLHNCDSVAKNVLNWLTLPDGEQAMPNGNDWSLFLYDQVTSYSTLACMLGDRDALLFEGQALRQIGRRQATTADGSWLLRPDVGARRMGVQAHRVMMTWLMHHVFPTDGISPSTWDDFRVRHSRAKVFPCQRVVRTLTDNYFACFSFSEGKRSFTGYVAPIGESYGNLVVPYRRHNTGNIIGGYELKGLKPGARLVGEPTIEVKGSYFKVQATLLENDSALERRFTLSTTAKGMRYDDRVRPLRQVEVVRDRTGMLAIADDVFAGDGVEVKPMGGGDALVGGTLLVRSNGDGYELGDRSTDNSVTTLKFYPFAKKLRWKHSVRYVCR